MPDDIDARRVSYRYGDQLVTQEGIEERAAAALAKR
jgi:hypothetical protein